MDDEEKKVDNIDGSSALAAGRNPRYLFRFPDSKTTRYLNIKLFFSFVCDNPKKCVNICPLYAFRAYSALQAQGP
jgi:hypothetical protein